MSKKICLITFFLAFLFLSPQKVFAVSLLINDPPSAIGSDPFTLSVTVIGASAGTNYLRVDLYKEGTTNYFGETFNGSSWYGDSDGKQYFPVTIPNDNPFIVQARIGDTIPSTYDGTGEYKLRIRRYTASGNYNNDEAKTSAIPIAIIFPTPTVTPTNSPTPTKTPTPTKVPTQTKAQTVTKSASPTKVATIVPTKLIAVNIKSPQISISKNNATDTAYPTAVLGARISISPTKSPDKKVLVKESSNNATVIASSLIVGGIFILACAILIFFRIRKQES
jgi:hypothetical protein